MTRSAVVLIANAQDSTISTYRLDGEQLSPLQTTPLPGASSTFAVDAERRLVYAGVKAGEGMAGPAIVTLALDVESGALTEQSRRTVAGGMNYLMLSGDVLLGASYGDDYGATWQVRDGVLSDPVSEISFPNLHCVRASRDGRHAYWVSLGSDQIAQYALAADGRLTPLDPPTVPAPAGSGPRHLILDAEGVNAYVITEFSGEVIRHARDPRTGVLTHAEKISIADPKAGLKHSRFGADPAAEHLIWGADLHIARDGEYLLATERCASTIASVALATGGRLNQVVAVRPTQQQPRGFQVTADGTRALVVGEKATEAMLYRITPTGELAELGSAPTGNGANWVRIIEK